MERRTEFEELAQRFYALCVSFENIFHNFARRKKDPTTSSQPDPPALIVKHAPSRREKGIKIDGCTCLLRFAIAPRAIHRIRLQKSELYNSRIYRELPSSSFLFPSIPFYLNIFLPKTIEFEPNRLFEAAATSNKSRTHSSRILDIDWTCRRSLQIDVASRVQPISLDNFNQTDGSAHSLFQTVRTSNPPRSLLEVPRYSSTRLNEDKRSIDRQNSFHLGHDRDPVNY